MTLDELTSKIKSYESKWGKLGHSSILRKEKDNEKSTDMNKDFYEFRKKVFNGSQNNKKSHAQMINVTDLNNRYYEEVTSNGTLIHAQSALYGTERENTKYYKREGDPGNYKYYYTKEEWDAAHKTKNSNSSEPNPKRISVDEESGKVTIHDDQTGESKKTNVTLEQFIQGSRMEDDRKIERTAKESSLSAGVKTLLKDERMQELFDQFEGGFENRGWTLNYDGTISGMTEDDENYVKSVQDWAKKFKDSTGVDLYGSKEFQDAVTKEIQNRWEKANGGSKGNGPKATDTTKKDAVEAESVSKKQEVKDNSETVKKEGPIKKRTKEEKSEDDKVRSDEAVKNYTEKAKSEDPKKVAKEIIKNRDFGIDELYHEVKESIKDGAMIWDGSDLVAVSSSKGDKKKYNKANEYVNEIYRDMAKYIDAIAEDSGKGAELWKEVRTIMSNKFDRLSKKYAPSNKEAKHSAIEEEDMNINKVQSTNKGDEILDEYRAFKERANRGAAANRLSHSSMISAADLNARYEEEQRKQCILVHSGKNYKYYNKIELPSGETRYFYTKAEWDAYRNNGGKQYAVNNHNESDNKQHANNEPGFLIKAKEYNQNLAQRTIDNIFDLSSAPHTEKKALKEAYNRLHGSLVKKYDERENKSRKVPDNYPFKNDFKNINNFVDSEEEKLEKQIVQEYLSNVSNEDKKAALHNSGKILKDGFDNIDKVIEEEIVKREKSIEAFNKLINTLENKVGIIEDDVKSLSKFEKQVLADELGLDNWSDEAIAKKYGYDEKALKNDPGDDYGAAAFEKANEGMLQFWNDYKAAKKALSSNASNAKDDED